MLAIDITTPKIPRYETPYIEISGAPHTVSVSIEDGSNTFRSETFDLGVLRAYESRRILGSLSFTYDYQEAKQTITVCGTDFESSQGMALTTVPEGINEHAVQYASPGGFVADDVIANPGWNYQTRLMPGVVEVLRRIAREANESLITALREVPGLTVRVRSHVPELPSELYEKLLVRRQGQVAGPHRLGDQLQPQDIVHTIESTFGGTADFGKNIPFANVIGSTNDPKIDKQTWIGLWSATMDVYPTICTSFEFDGFDCSDSLVGGHVVKGKLAKEVDKGSNDVYILPICQSHNTTDKVYMETLEYSNAVWLKNYLGS